MGTGFFDGWEEPAGGAGAWVKQAEKDDMVEKQTPFKIIGVTFDSSNEFEGRPSPRYVVKATIHTGPEGEPEERLLGFGVLGTDGRISNRDLMLEAMVNYFATTPEEDIVEPVVYLEKHGRAYLIFNYAGSEAEKNAAPFS